MSTIDINEIEISTAKARLDIDLIIDFLHNESYWARERPVDVITKSIEHALCVGMYYQDKQIGFARIVTDYATVFYLGDVFIIPEMQKKGLGHILMHYIEDMKELQGLRGILTTQTAHRFYEEFGYSADNEIVKKRMMVKLRPGDR